MLPSFCAATKHGFEVFWAAVAALGTVATAVIAYYGFARWETLRRKERQANFAEESFLLTLDVWDYLRRATVNLNSVNSEDFHKEGATLWDYLHSDELIQRLSVGRQRLQLYLPDAGKRGALELWTRYENLYRILNMNLGHDMITGATLRRLYDEYTRDDAWLFDELETATVYFRSYAVPE